MLWLFIFWRVWRDRGWSWGTWRTFRVRGFTSLLLFLFPLRLASLHILLFRNLFLFLFNLFLARSIWRSWRFRRWWTIPLLFAFLWSCIFLRMLLNRFLFFMRMLLVLGSFLLDSWEVFLGGVVFRDLGMIMVNVLLVAEGLVVLEQVFMPSCHEVALCEALLMLLLSLVLATIVLTRREVVRD